VKEKLKTHTDKAILSKRLVTIDTNVPVSIDFHQLKLSGGTHNPLAPNFHFIERAFRTSESLIALIDRLLDISMLQTGKIVPLRKIIKARDLADMRIANISHTADEKKVRIVNEVPVETRLFADPALFGEVIHNLLTNAIKFTSAGDVIILGAMHHGGTVTLSVKDTGAGIDSQLLPSLFKHEVKTSTLGTAGEKGSGLGLPYCGDILAAHGGTLWAESEKGRGAVFYIRLPEVKMIILMVDDQPVHRRTMIEFIGRVCEADIIEAQDGKEALEILKETTPHMVITDIQMPELNGLELLRIMKENPVLAAIPVIVTTSFASSSDSGEIDVRSKAIDLGAADFVTKPVCANDFIPRVKKFL